MTYHMILTASRIGFALAITLPLAAAPAVAADTGMKMPAAKAVAATVGHRFELAAPAKSAGGGKSLVSIRLLLDGKPVTGAIIIQSRADMSPGGMAAMTAPIKSLGEQPLGTYRFEIVNGPVAHGVDDWAVSFSAKVQGVAQTVSGRVIVRLSP